MVKIPLSLVLKNQNNIYIQVKRITDIVLSLLALVFLLPIFIPIIIILRFTGEKEIFYLQNRIGISMKNIRIIKFATMLKNSESMGSGIYTAKSDSRILPFGNFLRKTKINELPQLINILIGDMSIVGPRPLIKQTFELYSNEDQILISSIKPGLTGIGSIIFRNEEELLSESKMPLEDFYSKYITPYKAALEKWYLLNKSFMTDMKIIFLTAFIIVLPSVSFVEKMFNDLPIQKYDYL